MPLPVVAIVGRPNVGKSSLLNASAGVRISIVDSTAGTTRDRVSTPIGVPVEHEDWPPELLAELDRVRNAATASPLAEQDEADDEPVEVPEGVRGMSVALLHDAPDEPNADANEQPDSSSEAIQRTADDADEDAEPDRSEPAREVWFELMDTGGVGVVDIVGRVPEAGEGLANQDAGKVLLEHVEDQIRYALASATLVLFVVDAAEGIVPLDRIVAEQLRKIDKPVMLIANKVDGPRLDGATGEFERLGFGAPFAVSAKTERNMGDLLYAVAVRLLQMGAIGGAPGEPIAKIALVGKRNAGKSSFLNAAVGQERVIVSEIPGTTRDSVDVRFEKDGRTLIIIDTAGVRKKKSLKGDIEFYSFHRAQRSIRRADVVLLMIDAEVPISEPDKKLADEIGKQFKPFVLVVNKWDLAKDRASQTEYREYLDKVLPGFRFAPVVFTTAKDSRNVQMAIDAALRLAKQASIRVGTGKLNRALEHALSLQSPPLVRGRKPPRIYFMTQVGTNPVTIVVSVNDPLNFSEAFQRYLVNTFRELLPFREIPIRLLLRGHRRKSDDAMTSGPTRRHS